MHLTKSIKTWIILDAYELYGEYIYKNAYKVCVCVCVCLCTYKNLKKTARYYSKRSSS
jgi:hypothetical protein